MELVLTNLVAYLISVAAGLRTNAIGEARATKLEELIGQQQRELLAIRSRKTLKERVGELASDTARLMQELGVSNEREAGLWNLFSDPLFCSDFAEWLAHWELPDPDQAESRLRERMEQALVSSGASKTEANECVSDFFKMSESLIFESGPLAQWRHHLALQTLHEQQEQMLDVLRESQGEFSEPRIKESLEKYREMALKQFDIIDLAGLPEDDRNLAMRSFVLRQLYIPLRINLDVSSEAGDFLSDIEELRDQTRLAAAGRITPKPKTSDVRRKSVGDLITQFKKLVVLGDPGGGKTTLMRWLATAYLLRLNRDEELQGLPDAETLPRQDLLPILVRCRELPRDADCKGLEDILAHFLSVIDIPSKLRGPLMVALRRNLENGTALLMIDGLDEIQDPQQRTRFCRRLENFSALFPNTTVIVSSRIVGYREMHFRLGEGFRHGTVADLELEEMDAFAKQWVKATEHESKQEAALGNLIESIHSSDRVERLASNPMLLTTLALVHRRIGRMPQKRHELYREAIQVLLNWRHEIDERLELSEAVPQLEYIAYSMCERGVQRLNRDELIDLLEEMRAKYQSRLRDVGKRSIGEFIDLLEQRSSILFQAGAITVDEREIPVYEFRHLTFQEYLAGRAIVDGRFSGHDPKIRIPERVTRVAAKTERDEKSNELTIVESWREPLRLCIACCPDDDVDDAMEAILSISEQGKGGDRRARAIMAALCLADEPSVSDEIAHRVLDALIAEIKEMDSELDSLLNAALTELQRSDWAKELRIHLVDEFVQRRTKTYATAGLLAGQVGVCDAHSSKEIFAELSAEDEVGRTTEALVLLHRAFNFCNDNTTSEWFSPAIVEQLIINLASKAVHLADSSAWTLGWLLKAKLWVPNNKQLDELTQIHQRLSNSFLANLWLATIFADTQFSGSVNSLREKLNGASDELSIAVVWALGRIGHRDSADNIALACQTNDNDVVRVIAYAALIRILGPAAPAPNLWFNNKKHLNKMWLALMTIVANRDNMKATPIEQAVSEYCNACHAYVRPINRQRYILGGQLQECITMHRVRTLVEGSFSNVLEAFIQKHIDDDRAGSIIAQIMRDFIFPGPWHPAPVWWKQTESTKNVKAQQNIARD